jgi:hypothetical protein
MRMPGTWQREVRLITLMTLIRKASLLGPEDVQAAVNSVISFWKARLTGLSNFQLHSGAGFLGIMIYFGKLKAADVSKKETKLRFGLFLQEEER